MAQQTTQSTGSPELSLLDEDTRYVTELSKMSFTVPREYGINIEGGCEGGCVITYEIKKKEGIALTGTPSSISITESRNESNSIEEVVKNNLNKFENPDEITFKGVKTLKYTDQGLFGVSTDYFLIKDGFSYHIQCLDEEEDELVKAVLKSIKL